MNWVFETYSNVYNTAMMIETKPAQNVAIAKKAGAISKLVKFFGRG
jgi:hypothetical protein